ncbi:unnamed protein product [Brassica rapa subsp. trilocularis]|uniref:(rape) hypothetical protein n=1 Tax=Brassica napus TaxID=3708 RepID=A0A816WFS7_BRANA|nr:unnamed protein product [Brassica napus]
MTRRRHAWPRFNAHPENQPVKSRFELQWARLLKKPLSSSSTALASAPSSSEEGLPLSRRATRARVHVVVRRNRNNPDLGDEQMRTVPITIMGAESLLTDRHETPRPETKKAK